jgi:hypothetical protein
MIENKQSNFDHLELKETLGLYKALMIYDHKEKPQFLQEIFSNELIHNTSQ